jgi:hypothetical protein
LKESGIKINRMPDKPSTGRNEFMLAKLEKISDKAIKIESHPKLQ